MLKKCFVAMTFIVFFLVPSWALADTIPKLQPGQFVYTYPPHFEPPLIGKFGIVEINQQAAKLHYPYFVVLVNDLPGGRDFDAAKMVDNFAAAWTERYPGLYNPQTSQIFLLTYNPRKFRFLAGAKFRTELKFERNAHQPYTDIFVASVKGTPKIPKTGILNMMKAVDEYLYKSTDPAYKIARRNQIILWSVFIGLFLVLLLLFIRYRMLYKRQQDFDMLLKPWQEKVQNAYQQFTRFQTKERNAILGLKSMTGETGNRYQALTTELDEILLSLAVIEAHIEQCTEIAQQASLFSFAPLIQAESRLLSQIECDSKEINRKELFGAPVLKLKIDIRLFMSQLQDRFRKAQEGWDALCKIAELIWKRPEELLPLTLKDAFLEFDEVLRQALTHPLNPPGGEADVKALYERLEKLRWEDALSYQAEIQKIQDEHQTLIHSLATVDTYLKQIDEHSRIPTKTRINLVLNESDQPARLRQRAEQCQEQLNQSLQSGAPFARIQEQAQKTAEIFLAFVDLEKQIDQALSDLPYLMGMLSQQLQDTLDEMPRIKEMAEKAKRYFRNSKGIALGQQAITQLNQAQEKLHKAQTYEASSRLLEAYRLALEAKMELDNAQQHLQEILADIQELERIKALFEKELGSLTLLAEEYNPLMTQYDSNIRFTPPSYSLYQAQNYAELLQECRECKNTWAIQLNQAQNLYFEKKEMAELRRKEREREYQSYNTYSRHSTHHHYDHSHYSNSDSTYSNNDSDDSGSSYSGGDSSSSGGDYTTDTSDSSSSGGDW